MVNERHRAASRIGETNLSPIKINIKHPHGCFIFIGSLYEKILQPYHGRNQAMEGLIPRLVSVS